MRFTSLLVAILVVGCSKSEPPSSPAPEALPKGPSVVIDVTKIAGKSKAEVEAIIGAATSCEQSKYGEQCVFSKADTEIVFIDGKSDWITVSSMGSVPYSASAIEAIGFKAKDPTFRNEYVIRWENILGFLEVSVNPGESGRVSYAYVKVATR